MMDSQENVLTQENQEEKNVEATVVNEVNAQPEEENAAAETECVQEEMPEADAKNDEKTYKTKKDVVERITEIAQSEDNPQKEEVEYLKTTFYKLHQAEREANLKAYLEAGGEAEKYQVVPDEDEEKFKAELSIIKEKRAKIFLQQESEKQENYKKKLDIIEKIKAMTTSPEDANNSYQDFKKLQQEWKEIKLIPADKANELWRSYQLYVEQFYDLLKLNSEAREYDFK
ncbi:MAG: DUF349 domain-containing protein, partial [Prevotella sp.]|nr:DUF349 domain-containing protein [Prevotella sp.]